MTIVRAVKAGQARVRGTTAGPDIDGQKLRDLIGEVAAETRLIKIPGNHRPWIPSGMRVTEGEAVTWLAWGRASLIQPIGLSVREDVVGVFNLATNTANIFFFTDADLDSSNVILTAPLSALGLSASAKFDFSVFAFDNYFTGDLTDAIEGLTYTPTTPRFAAFGVPTSGVPTGGSSTLTIQSVPGGDVASPSQTGILLMYRDGKEKQEADAIRVEH